MSSHLALSFGTDHPGKHRTRFKGRSCFLSMGRWPLALQGLRSIVKGMRFLACYLRMEVVEVIDYLIHSDKLWLLSNRRASHEVLGQRVMLNMLILLLSVARDGFFLGMKT